jgi:hypothetical protein
MEVWLKWPHPFPAPLLILWWRDSQGRSLGDGTWWLWKEFELGILLAQKDVTPVDGITELLKMSWRVTVQKPFLKISL